MDGIGLVLREPVNSLSEEYPILDKLRPSRILIHARFDGSKAAPRRAQKYDHEMRTLSALDVESSLLVPEEDLKKVIKVLWSRTLFVEVSDDSDSNENVTIDLVTKLLSERPDIKIGIVATLHTLISGKRVVELTNLLLSDNRIFPCPIIGEDALYGMTRLEEFLSFMSVNFPRRTVPFVSYLADDEKADFQSIRGRWSENFPELVFCSLQVAAGIEFTEVQMQTEGELPAPLEGMYVALEPVGLREGPSRNAAVVGNVITGDPYNVVKLQKSMGIQFGKLDNGLWVILEEGPRKFFEKETE